MASDSSLKIVDVLHIESLREIFGGFAHEIAQPLNVIMIAVQVIQLKLDRLELPEGEREYLWHRLKTVTAETEKAADMLNTLRYFCKPTPSGQQDASFLPIFEKVYGIMSRQFLNREIQVSYSSDINFSFNSCVNIIESVLIQGLAFARDSITTLSLWHQNQNIPFEKQLLVSFQQSVEGPSVIFNWSSGLSEQGCDYRNHVGMCTAELVLGSMGGAVRKHSSGFSLVFPNS